MFRAIDHACQALRKTRCGWSAGLIAICLCIVAATPNAAASVIVLQPQPSSPYPRIHVHFEGKPFANAKIEVFRDPDPSGEPRLTLVTDEHGSAKIPKLPIGKYLLSVSGEPKLQGDLLLKVSPWVSNSASQFTIDLQCCAPPTYEEIVASAEEQATQDHLQSFQGLVTDQSGAPIPNVAIDVVVRGTRGTVHVAALRSDLNGRFSVHIEDGQYVAFFSSSGFSVRVLPFTVSQQSGIGELHVTLQIGRTG